MTYRDQDICMGRLQQEIHARIPKGTWQGDIVPEWHKAALEFLRESRLEAAVWRRDALEMRARLGLNTCATAPDCEGCPDCGRIRT